MPSITPQASLVPISQIRSRNEVLKHLVPKIFGIICEKGQYLDGFPGCGAKLDGELTLIGSHLGPDRIVLNCLLAAEISDHESVFRSRNRFAQLRRSELLPFLERPRRIIELAAGSVGGCGDGSPGHAIVSFRGVSAGRFSD